MHLKLAHTWHPAVRLRSLKPDQPVRLQLSRLQVCRSRTLSSGVPGGRLRFLFVLVHKDTFCWRDRDMLLHVSDAFVACHGVSMCARPNPRGAKKKTHTHTMM